MRAFVMLADIAFLALLASSMFTDIVAPAMGAKDRLQYHDYYLMLLNRGKSTLQQLILGVNRQNKSTDSEHYLESVERLLDDFRQDCARLAGWSWE